MARDLATVLLLLGFSSLLVAQVQSSSACELSVRVRTSNERSIEAPIHVEVLASQGLIAAAQVVGDHSAEFQVACGKTYSLTVSGTDIETVTTPYFEINSLEQLHTETVHVKFVKQKTDDASAPGSPSISVSEMNVPKKASTEMDKGLDAYSRGDMEKAAAYFQRAIAEYPSYARAYDMLGVTVMKNSSPNRAKARELFSKAIQVDSTFWPGYVDLARMDVQDKNYAESETLLAKAIAGNPSMLDAMALLATAEFANQQYDKALADVERIHALHNHEQFAELHIMAGKVLSMEGHPQEAVAQFQLFLKEKPDSPEVGSVRKQIAALEVGQQP
jgi:tetratricopeptide (TPR) repeat protein